MKTLTATAFMWLVGAGIIYLMGNFPDSRLSNCLRLAVVVPSAAAVYLLAAKFLHIKMLSLLTGARPVPAQGQAPPCESGEQV
jgi:hypothetical protein